MAGPGLLAHVLVSKYADHLPLYRQSDIYDREGVDLPRSTLANWVGGAARTLEPLVELLRRYVLQATKLHGDDIPVPVLSPGDGKTRTGRFWTYVRDDRPAANIQRRQNRSNMQSRKVSLKIGLRLCPHHRPVRLRLSTRQSAGASPQSPAPELLET
jgi:hypothetical protein